MKDSPIIASVTRYKSSSGQALAELIIACAILAVIMTGLVTVINFSLNSTTIALNKTLSYYYTQQLLEEARGARNESSSALNSFVGTFTDPTNGTPIANTVFRRHLTLTDTPGPTQDVSASVWWFDGTREYRTTLETALAD